jgi:hypothetical protein
MDVENGLEVVVGHLLQRGAANDACVVDQDVDPAVAIQRGVDNGLATFGGGNGIGTRHGFASRGGDLAHDVLGGPGVGAVT